MHNSDDYEFNEIEESYFPEYVEPDHYFLEAQEDIKSLYESNRNSVYYVRQLQVKFEKKYYHWITHNALMQLYKYGYLKEITMPREKGTSTHFFVHRSNRYPKREINRMEKVIVEYSQDHITRSCGHRAEDLFCLALSKRGFMPIKEKVRDYNGKEWIKTGYDLDFIFRRDDVSYGCEIKNTLGYIEKEELEIKIDMCKFFGVKPLFIMRGSPKTYNKMIIDAGGFALIFESQIYELSQEALVRKIKKVLGLPVVCTKAIPDVIINHFEKWHNRHIM